MGPLLICGRRRGSGFCASCFFLRLMYLFLYERCTGILVSVPRHQYGIDEMRAPSDPTTESGAKWMTLTWFLRPDRYEGGSKQVLCYRSIGFR